MLTASVLLPVYNGAATLRETIDSVLAQSEPDFEFLIIDDASRDASAQIIREYAARDPRIRAVVHEQNRGLAASLNEGLESAGSELILRIDQDDVALPRRLRTQVDFMRSRPEVGAAGSHVYHMGRKPKYDRLVRLPAEHEDIMRILPRQNCMYHPAMMLRRSAALEVGGYREQFRNAEDYDLWLRLSRRWRLANVQEPLMRYRFSVGGMSFSRRWEQMRDVQMAIAAYENPDLEGAALEQAADLALARIDRHDFFEQVARGTLMELVLLRNWSDAWRIYRLFAPSLKPAASWPLTVLVFKQLVRIAIGRTG